MVCTKALGEWSYRCGWRNPEWWPEPKIDATMHSECVVVSFQESWVTGRRWSKIWYGPYKQLKGQQCRRGLGILGAVASLENRQCFVSSNLGKPYWPLGTRLYWLLWMVWLESGHQTRSFLGFPLIRHFFLCSLCQKWGTTPGSLLEKEAEDAVESGFLVLLLSRCLIT